MIKSDFDVNRNGVRCARRHAVGMTIAAIMVLAVITVESRGEDWPQWRGPTRDGVWHESGIMSKLPQPRMPIKWKAEIGSGYSGPTVANGRVYVTDRVTRPTQIERVHCFDADSGKQIWSHSYDCEYRGVSYDAGPRASVLIHDGLAYSLGSMGNLFCFDAATGKVAWSKDLNSEYKIRMPIWGIAASPIIDGDRLIVAIGGENAFLVAFDRKSGKELWKSLNDPANYSAPIMIEQAGKQVLVIWSGEAVVGVDPASGKEYWREPFKPAQVIMGVATPVRHKDRLFLTGFFDGSLMLRVPSDRVTVETIWKVKGASHEDTAALHSTIGTPIVTDDYIYGVDSYGELRCLKASDGERVWENLKAVPKARWSTIHFVTNGDDTWMFNERGELLVGRLTPKGFEERSRSLLIEPTMDQLRQRGGVCWSHPAFANRCVFARNDNELVCASLAADDGK